MGSALYNFGLPFWNLFGFSAGVSKVQSANLRWPVLTVPKKCLSSSCRLPGMSVLLIIIYSFTWIGCGSLDQNKGYLGTSRLYFILFWEGNVSGPWTAAGESLRELLLLALLLEEQHSPKCTEFCPVVVSSSFGFWDPAGNRIFVAKWTLNGKSAVPGAVLSGSF